MSSSSTSTSLTLRALLKTAATRLGLGVPGRGVSGLTPAAKAFFAAAAAARGPGRPRRADRRGRGAAHLRRAVLSLGPRRALGRRRRATRSSRFPSHEIDPYRGLSPHFDIASARARTLYALSTGTARLVIASAAALLPRLSSPGRFKATGFALRSGDEISPIDLGDRLAEAGYTRQDPTDEPGEFSVRGGVVDFYRRRRAASDPAGVRRRHDRIAPHLRPRHPAVDRADRSGAHRSAAGAAGSPAEAELPLKP